MQTNDRDRDQQIIQAMCDYQLQLTTPERMVHIPTWIAAHVPDTTLHAEVHEAIEFALALGPLLPHELISCTPEEHAMADRAAERARQRWRERVAAMQREDQ